MNEMTKTERATLWELLTRWAGVEADAVGCWFGRQARLLAGEKLAKRHESIVLPEYDCARLLRVLGDFVETFKTTRPAVATWARRRILELDPNEQAKFLDQLAVANAEADVDDFGRPAKGGLADEWANSTEAMLVGEEAGVTPRA